MAGLPVGKTKYNIKQMRVNGESGDVSGQTVDSWKEHLPEILRGYTAENIWNLDETGCFWRALPVCIWEKRHAMPWRQEGKAEVHCCFTGKHSWRERTTHSDMEVRKPQCFKGIKIDQLPVKNYSQSKAWMAGDILDAVLTKWNRRLSFRRRSIALLMDNAGCHPEEL